MARAIRMPFWIRSISAGTLILSACPGCSLLQKQDEPDPLSFKAMRTSPLSSEETKEVASEVGGNWLYGQGMGEAALNVGAIAVFPPYAAVVAGNAALSLSGYKPIGVSTALPEAEGTSWSETFDLITSGPGRFAAALAGKEYRTKEVARARLKPILENRAAGPSHGSIGAAEAASPEDSVAEDSVAEDSVAEDSVSEDRTAAKKIE